MNATRLRRHLAVCPDCAEWAAGATATATTLRAQELEQPPARIEIGPLQRGTRRAAAMAAAVASVAVVALAAVAVDRQATPRHAQTAFAFAPLSQCYWCSRLQQMTQVDDGAFPPPHQQGRFQLT